MMNIPNAKLRFACLIERCLPTRYCWAELAAWAMLDQPFPKRLKRNECKPTHGCCWCGKFCDGKLNTTKEATKEATK